MDARLVKEYRDRWKAVKAVELEEQRRTSITRRWQQLNGLYAMALSLGLSCPDREKELETIRARWARVKDRL